MIDINFIAISGKIASEPTYEQRGQSEFYYFTMERIFAFNECKRITKITIQGQNGKKQPVKRHKVGEDVLVHGLLVESNGGLRITAKSLYFNEVKENEGQNE